MTEERRAEIREKRVAAMAKARAAKKAQRDAKNKLPAPPGAFAFFCRTHTGNELGDAEMRVWREGWAGDQFMVISSRQFSRLLRLMTKFAVPIYLLDADEDEQAYDDKNYGALHRLSPADLKS